MKLIVRTANGERVTPAILGVGPRQIYYYWQAAEVLGFLGNDRRILPAARAIRFLPHDARLSRLAIAFVESAWGRRWAEWQGVSSLLEVDLETAAQFLADIAGLRGTMQKRRASTLRSWCKKLLPRHPSRWQPSTTRARPRPPVSPCQEAVFAAADSAKLLQSLAAGTHLFRVSTAYFTVNGYEPLSQMLPDAHWRILVGSREAEEAIKEMLSEVLRCFRADIEAGLPSPKKRHSVYTFYMMLVTGALPIYFLDPRYRRLHAKVYLFDDVAAYVTSANLTHGGLYRNIEAGLPSLQKSVVESLLSRFDELFAQAKRISEQFLPPLEGSWVFAEAAEPYLLYLRVLLEMYEDVPDVPEVPQYKLADYQRMIVGSVLHVLREQRGALLIAPTGTGKSVMGSYLAAALFRRSVFRIFVFCPNDLLRKDWEEKLCKFQLIGWTFSHASLQQLDHLNDHNKAVLDDLMANICSTDLVIVDECHAFRNATSDGFKQLQKLLAGSPEKGQPYRLLLTATPVSRDWKELNTLLALVGDERLQTLREVAYSRSIVNITLPFIINHFGILDEEGKRTAVLDFSGQRRSFGRERGRPENYCSSMEDVFEQIDKMRFRFRSTRRMKGRDSGQQSILPGFNVEDVQEAGCIDAFYTLLLLRTAESSPPALTDMSDSLASSLLKGRTRNSPRPLDPQRLRADLKALRKCSQVPRADTKLQALVALLNARAPDERVLIFSYFRATVHYLTEELRRRLQPPRRVDFVTGELPSGARKLKLERLAPLAHDKPNRRRKDDIDVLVATDCIAEGQNLQDVSLVINYDLPWTPLKLIQRRGRVDRPTKHERSFEVVSFYPDASLFDKFVGLKEKLRPRADIYFDLARTVVLDEYDRDPAQAREEGLKRALTDKGEYEAVLREHLPTSHFLVDRAKATPQEIAAARNLSIGSRAAMATQRPGMFALLRTADGKGHALFCEESSGRLYSTPETARERLLDFIRAERGTPLATMPENIDEAISSLVKRWAQFHGMDPSEVTVVCAEATVAEPTS